jgi:hypothetical protein
MIRRTGLIVTVAACASASTLAGARAVAPAVFEPVREASAVPATAASGAPSTATTAVARRNAPRENPTAAPTPAPDGVAPYPSFARIHAAARYLAGRAGTTAFAVVNDHGVLAGGVNVHRRFHSASVVKSMLLIADLQLLAEQRRPLDGAARDLLYPMIHSSNNDAATDVLRIVGDAGLERVAREAHMVDFETDGAYWGFSEVSAADLARFFYEQDELIPRQFEGYARWLLSTIEASESWGVPAIARPEFQVFFKGGWLPEYEGLVNQAARLERPGIVFAVAVLTINDPTMTYGERTIAGVTLRLLGRVG